MKRTFLIFVILLCGAYAGKAQGIMPLYPGGIPNATQAPDAEISKDNGGSVGQVSLPTLTAFLPKPKKANGTAVIICPGGGYRTLVIGREGNAVAKAFNKIGVAAFVLKYRLPSDETMKDKSIGPLQDAQQAIKTVRQRAAEWKVNPDKIGIIGFSAGGHLAASAGTHFNKTFIENKENTSLRPDFMLLVYPVISMTDELAHAGSRERLLGKNPSQEQIDFFSNELQVTPETPPAFLLHAGDDQTVKVENSIRFYEAEHKNSIPAGLHIYPTGGHGFPRSSAKDNWMGQCVYWLKSNGWI